MSAITKAVEDMFKEREAKLAKEKKELKEREEKVGCYLCVWCNLAHAFQLVSLLLYYRADPLSVRLIVTCAKIAWHL